MARDPISLRAEAALALVSLDLGWLARLRDLDPLRGDPAFEALRRTSRRAPSAWRRRGGPEQTLDGAFASLAFPLSRGARG